MIAYTKYAIEFLSMKETSASFFNKCTDTFTEIMFSKATMKAIALDNEPSFQIHLCIVDRRLDTTSNRAGK